jgi:TonB family protein
LAGPAARARFLPEALAREQRLSGTQPEFPRALATAGALFVIHAKICVDRAGAVDRVTLVRGAEPTLDANVLAATRGWRYRPLAVDGTAVPFCTLVRFEFRAE